MPHGLPNVDRGTIARKMLTYFYGQSLSDAQATSSEQRQKNMTSTFCMGDDLFHFLRRARGSVLFLRVDDWQANEMRVPFSGMNLLAFIVDCARYHRLKDLKVRDDGFVRKSSVFHFGDQFLCSSVLDVRQREIAYARNQPFYSALVSCNCRWLHLRSLPAVQHAAIFNRLDPPVGLLPKSG